MDKGLYDVDIDAQKVNFEGEWMTKDELAEKIRRLIDGQDFRIGAAGNALEFLQNTLANVQEFSVRIGPSDADFLHKHAKKAGLDTGVFIRQAILAYLAAQPPIEQEGLGGGAEGEKISLTTITTEPAKPGEETQAVELTEKKSQAHTSKVLVDPSLQVEEHPGIASEETWFKK
jgi:hypothetical protein